MEAGSEAALYLLKGNQSINILIDEENLILSSFGEINITFNIDG